MRSREPGIIAPQLHVGVDKEYYWAEGRMSQQQEVGWSLRGSVSRSQSRRRGAFMGALVGLRAEGDTLRERESWCR